VIPDDWADLRGLPIGETADAGLINQTYLAGHMDRGDLPRFVVQRVNPIFAPSVHEDIEAVTAHLQGLGMVSPRLVRTDSGALCAVADSGVWRVLTFVPGKTLHRLTDATTAYAAGALVARFHKATDSLEWAYKHVRPGAHDSVGHMRRLEAAASADVPDGLRLADEVLAAWQRWSGDLALPERHAHGDLKISNLRFSDAGEGVCLLDLDTLSRLSMDIEMGDALRSWCNPVGEDGAETYFDIALFTAAMKGYLSERALSPSERGGVVSGVERISLELASRFCRDVFEDNYFGWNDKKFPSRQAHNLFRAQGQLRLALSARGQRSEMERVLG
jgi:Ser/Thr protein kinase RdoA (MazF antagonist)